MTTPSRARWAWCTRQSRTCTSRRTWRTGSVGFVVGNPELKPERSVSYDLGLRWGPRTLAISGNVFYSTFADLINALPIKVNMPGTPSRPEIPDTVAYEYTNIATA